MGSRGRRPPGRGLRADSHTRALQLTLTKRTFGGRYRLQVRLELVNVFNRHSYADPVTDIANPYFGSVPSTTGEPRKGQIGLRFEF